MTPEPPESWSPWNRWKASSAALTWRYRTERGFCSSCGEHPAGESCRWDGGVAPTEEPEWVTEILAYFEKYPGDGRPPRDPKVDPASYRLMYHPHRVNLFVIPPRRSRRRGA